jgi:hypothetical protein
MIAMCAESINQAVVATAGSGWGRAAFGAFGVYIFCMLIGAATSRNAVKSN